MAILFLNMEYLAKHVAQYERRFPTPFPVQNIGFVRKKAGGFIHNRRFNTINFSLIMQGSGTYQSESGISRVIAPYLITQSDQFEYSYGPGDGEEWTELYFMYSLETKEALKQIGFYENNRKEWPIRNVASVESLIYQLKQIVQKKDIDRYIDLIDRLCELIILESKRDSPTEKQGPYQKKLNQIRQEIDLNPERNYDFNDLAIKVGISYSAFRKYWKRFYQKAPQEYLSDRRIQEARCLLAETEMSVSDIAYQLNFEDRLYFSKKFRKATGFSATEYRKIHFKIMA